jgi:hypothetical protein
MEASVSLVGEPLLVLEGVRGLAVRGVQFECTRGHAVEAQSCTDVRVEDCVFRAIGVRALRLDGSENRVARCRFLDIGGTGVLLTGGDRTTLAPGGNAVERCDFRECGRVLRSDPGMGVIRHADAGYDLAIDAAASRGVHLPHRAR